jgi:hypothetical protein
MIAPKKGMGMRWRDAYVLDYFMWRYAIGNGKIFHTPTNSTLVELRMNYQAYSKARGKLAEQGIVKIHYKGINPRNVFVELFIDKVFDYFDNDPKLPKGIYNINMKEIEDRETERPRNMPRADKSKQFVAPTVDKTSALDAL